MSRRERGREKQSKREPGWVVNHCVPVTLRETGSGGCVVVLPNKTDPEQARTVVRVLGKTSCPVPSVATRATDRRRISILSNTLSEKSLPAKQRDQQPNSVRCRNK
ncbi:portal protein [Anopheles sinensis]|uniref:Portal protein n=1 Tax=Anopheles sinensis TaxID=74873 RepID=A0A084VA70_ANOSI|nr:portal protein [Anopheles sinensis]